MASTGVLATKNKKDLLLHKADFLKPDQLIKLYKAVGECGSYQQSISAIGTCILQQLDEHVMYPVEEVATIRQIVLQTRCAQGTTELDHYTKKLFENAGEL